MDFAFRTAISISHAIGRISDIFNGNANALRVFYINMVISNASCGDIHYTGLAKRKKNGIIYLSFMTDADASISKCQFNSNFRYRCICDSWRNAKARRHLSEQNSLVLPASINCNSHFWDG
jgi:hypothetical protein